MAVTGCSQALTGISMDCKNSMGGVKAIFFAPYTEKAATLNEDGDIITAIAGSEGDSFKYFYTKKNVSNMTSTLNIDATNGVNYVTTELSATFLRMDASKRIALNTLILSDVMAVVIDSNGEGWFLGKDEPVNVTAGTGNTGTAKTDGNNYQITLTDESMALPYPLDAALVEKFLQKMA